MFVRVRGGSLAFASVRGNSSGVESGPVDAESGLFEADSGLLGAESGLIRSKSGRMRFIHLLPVYPVAELARRAISGGAANVCAGAAPARGSAADCRCGRSADPRRDNPPSGAEI